MKITKQHVITAAVVIGALGLLWYMTNPQFRAQASHLGLNPTVSYGLF